MLWITEPYSELGVLRRNLQTLWQAAGGDGGPGYALPPINVYEDRDGYSLVADVPGIAKDKVDIRFENNVITLSGERPEPPARAEATFLRREREMGAFEKAFRFPTKVNADSVTAKLENGILIVRVPKAEEAKPKQIAIQA